MAETIRNWVNVCVLKEDSVLLLNRQHDDFSGWIPPGGKVEFPESFFEAAVRELKEETGLLAKNLKLKGISGFTNPIGNERFVFYDFVCDRFEGELLVDSPEGKPQWFKKDELADLEMQSDIRNRLPLYFREGSFESIHYWNEEKRCVDKTNTILYD